jgi:hypothetical protein
VHRIVIEEPNTAVGITLDDFPTLKRLVDSSACGERHFGRMRVIDICVTPTASGPTPGRIG